MNNPKKKTFASKNYHFLRTNESSKELHIKYPKPNVSTKQNTKKVFKKQSINSLPNELLLKVFQFFPIDTLQTAFMVCQHWKDLANDNYLWEQHFKSFFGIGPLYNKLKNLTVKPTMNQISWKTEFFKQCHIQSNKVMLRQKKNHFTGITDNVSLFLSTYKISFDLVVTDNSNKKHIFSPALRHSCRTSSFLQWNSLTGFPSLLKIQSICVVASVPLLLLKEKQHLPKKKSLVHLVEFETKLFEKHSTLLGCDNQHRLQFKLISGLMFGIWLDSNEIAFISLCLHHHNLVNKCLLSTYKKVYSVVHKPIADDIDSNYGMYGYQCHILVHTIKKTLWEQKFSYLSCSKEAGDGYLLMKPDQHTDTFNYADFVWKTELFSGKFQDVIIVDITMTDSNDEVIWAQSYPNKAVKTSVCDVFLDHTMRDSLFLLQHQDNVGLFSVTFSKEDCTFTPNVVLGLSFSHISLWFGIKC